MNASIVGLAAAGAGGTAVFITENQAGSTALLVLGGIGLLIGMTGRVPDRIGTEGVNYDPVDPATTAVENVLADSDVSLDTKETIASAVKEELDRRQIASISSPRPALSDRLARQTDAVLFEAKVRSVIMIALPPASKFVTGALLGGREVDGLIEKRVMGEVSGSIKRIVIEATLAKDLIRKFRNSLPQIADLAPDGLIYVANASHRPGRSKENLRNFFSAYAAEKGIPNAHLVFFDDTDEASAFELADSVRRAWDAL